MLRGCAYLHGGGAGVHALCVSAWAWKDVWKRRGPKYACGARVAKSDKGYESNVRSPCGRDVVGVGARMNTWQTS